MDSSTIIWIIWIAISVISALVIWIENFVRARRMDEFLSKENSRREYEYFHDHLNLLRIEVRELQTRVTELENQINIVNQ